MEAKKQLELLAKKLDLLKKVQPNINKRQQILLRYYNRL